jgi:hypothetical protein
MGGGQEARPLSAHDTAVNAVGTVVGLPAWPAGFGVAVPPGAGVDAGLLTVMRRNPPLLPVAMARSYADFVESHWPFGAMTGR